MRSRGDLTTWQDLCSTREASVTIRVVGGYASSGSSGVFTVGIEAFERRARNGMNSVLRLRSAGGSGQGSCGSAHCQLLGDDAYILSIHHNRCDRHIVNDRDRDYHFHKLPNALARLILLLVDKRA